MDERAASQVRFPRAAGSCSRARFPLGPLFQLSSLWSRSAVSQCASLNLSTTVDAKPIKVAVAVDGSENSIEALRAAIRMFGPTAKEIHIVHARRPFDHDFDVENPPLWQQPFQRMERQSRADSRALLGICCQMAAQETQRVRQAHDGPAENGAGVAGAGSAAEGGANGGSASSSPGSSPGHSAESSPTASGGRRVIVEAASLGVGGLEVKGVELRGDPRDVISNYSRRVGADMLVMGSRGNSMLKRFPMGSVSNYCMRNAACPVLIVPAPHTGATCPPASLPSMQPAQSAAAAAAVAAAAAAAAAEMP
ncbi:hypothetical protein CLOM_g22119 [Closterium sp. NIES-68]|nr:hypothetical protein CLOM_g22119 [Closterium sp. NIES-68]GJP74465.1 hypothetical protein CLOP_g5042 [Closterium sp. NIES-67]